MAPSAKSRGKRCELIAVGSLAIGNPTNALGLMGHFVSFSALFEPIKESEVPVPSDMMAIGDSFGGGVFFAWSAESMGIFWLWELSEVVI